MADTRTGTKIQKTSDSSVVAYSFTYRILISGVREFFNVDVFPDEMLVVTDLDEAKATADAFASAWKAQKTASPDPVVSVAEPAFTGNPSL